jgi:uncharacterized protein DUF11
MKLTLAPRGATRALLLTGLIAGAVLASATGASAQALPGPQLPPPPLQLNWKPDLTITMSDAPDPYQSYSTPLTYTITLRNAPVLTINGVPQGPTAQWVQMRQIIPTGYFVQSVSAPANFQCTHNTMNVICQGGPMAAGSSATIVVTGRPPNTIGYISSSATVDTWNLIEERSENNNSASAETYLPPSLWI